MKKLLFILMFSLPFAGFAQQLPEKDPSDENVFIAVEVMPEFPGGTEALMKYLAMNIRYPGDAREKNVQGRVFLTFIVSELGKVSDVKVLRGVYESIDVEAMRLVKNMPNWKPGTQGGQAVKVKYTLPVAFNLK